MTVGRGHFGQINIGLIALAIGAGVAFLIVNRRANGDRDRRAIGDQGLMRAYAVAGWRRA